MSRRLMSINEYLEITFTPESRPQAKTVQSWIEEGIIEGKRIGKKWWVYEESKAVDDLVRLVSSS